MIGLKKTAPTVTPSLPMSCPPLRRTLLLHFMARYFPLTARTTIKATEGVKLLLRTQITSKYRIRGDYLDFLTGSHKEVDLGLQLLET